MKPKISDYLLERYILNELPKKDMAEIKLLSEQEAKLKKRIELLRKDNEKILLDYPKEEVSGKILRKAHDSRWERITEVFSDLFKVKMLIPMLSFAAVAFLLLLSLPMLKEQEASQRSVIETEISKGEDVKLYVYAKHNGSTELLARGAQAREGDVLQVAYQIAKPLYGVILSIDGRDIVTLHFPEKETAYNMLAPGEKVTLSKSYELDDAPRYEKFVFVVSQNPINTQSIINSAKRFAAENGNPAEENIPLENNYTQYSFVVNKI